MSGESWIDIAVVLTSFLVLTTAGLVEASLIRTQRLTIRQLLDHGDHKDNQISNVEQSSRMRLEVDVAALVSVLLIGVFGLRIGMREFGALGSVATIAVAAVAVLLAGRVLPAAVVNRYGWTESPSIYRLASVLSALATPFLLVTDVAVAVFNRIAGPQESQSDLNGASRNGHEAENGDTHEADAAELQYHEEEMISAILDMDDVYVREIMVPRPDMIAIPSEAAIPDVVRTALEVGHSRIPVYGESIDKIEGIVYAKDLLRFVTDEFANVSLAELMRPAVFVPESKRVHDLLRDLRQSRVHMAVVVDEYGGTAGIVTIEDVLEEIVGEIQDEYDRETPLYSFTANGEMTVDGRIGLEEVAELIGVDLPESESETIGGFVQRELGHIPEPGERLDIGPVAIEVESVEGRRVRTLHVRVVEEGAQLDHTDAVQAY